MLRTLPLRARASRRRRLATCLLSLASLFATAAPSAACSWDYPIWTPRERDADPLYRFIRDGKAGYIDRSGKVVIEPRFDGDSNYGGVFHDGMLEVGVSSGEYVDATGKTVIKGELYRGWRFSDGLAAALKEDGGKWGYIDPTGKFVIPPRFKDADDFSEGLAVVGRFEEGEEGGAFYYIDRGGRAAIRGPFHFAGHFFKGLAHVELKPLVKREGEDIIARVRRFAYIDAKGKTVFAYEYEESR